MRFLNVILAILAFLYIVGKLGQGPEAPSEISHSSGNYPAETAPFPIPPDEDKLASVTGAGSTVSTNPSLVPPTGLAEPKLDESPVVTPDVPSRPPSTLRLARFVTGSVVNVRQGPSVSTAKIGALVFGTKTYVVGNADGGWVEIEFDAPPWRGWMSGTYLSAALPGTTATTPAAPPKRSVAPPSSAEVSRAKAEIIRQSINSYSGSCPCPYNTDRAGRRCGGRSAWSRPGGYAPMCYESDVSPARLATYFARQRGATN
ncbi:SH3 domain-containing protein [Psychromarinibacter sp. S121]|uniref:SH3 domain-containing protein n=1 Tax=Psychromarinibacter sp. S121 TaxID=3415127 RepID=UPI003C7A4A6E